MEMFLKIKYFYDYIFLKKSEYTKNKNGNIPATG